MDTPISVLLVDGHSRVRVALAERLRHTTGIAAVTACSTLDEARTHLAQPWPAVVLYDPRTIDAEPMAAIGLLRQSGCPVIVFTATALPEETVAWTRAGVAAILLKGLAVPDLLAQVAGVVQGR